MTPLNPQKPFAHCALMWMKNHSLQVIASYCHLHVTSLNDPLLASSFSTGFFPSIPVSGKKCSVMLDFGLSKNWHSIICHNHFMTITESWLMPNFQIEHICFFINSIAKLACVYQCTFACYSTVPHIINVFNFLPSKVRDVVTWGTVYKVRTQ